MPVGQSHVQQDDVDAALLEMSQGVTHPQQMRQGETTWLFLTEHLAQQACISCVILNHEDLERCCRQELESLAHVASTTPGISVPIVSSVIASPYGTFLIGAGTTHTIQSGSLVLTPQGFAVGRVTEVQSDTAVVQELFAQGIKTDARIGATPMQVIGSGGENAYAQAPRGASIQIGDMVNAPAFSHPVGVVGVVASSSAEAYQDVYIRLPDNLSALQYVYVVRL